MLKFFKNEIYFPFLTSKKRKKNVVTQNIDVMLLYLEVRIIVVLTQSNWILMN